MGYIILLIIWGKTFILHIALEFVEFHGIRGVCLKGHFGEKSSVNPSQFLLLLKMVWHMHQDDGDKDFQSSLPS